MFEPISGFEATITVELTVIIPSALSHLHSHLILATTLASREASACFLFVRLCENTDLLKAMQ